MTRVVSISDDAYAALERIKAPNDSFSDIILKLAEKERMAQLQSLMGTWKLTDAEAEALVKGIYERRRQSRPRRFNL